MTYQFKKGEFLISYQGQTSATTAVMACHQSLSQVSLAISHPGNLYLFSDNKWTLLDINTILPNQHPEKNYMERAATAMTISLTRLPINNSYLLLTINENKILTAIAHDLTTKGKISWLLPATIFQFENDKMTAVRSTGNVTYDISKIGDVRKSFDELPQMMSPGQVLISPHSYLSSLQTPGTLRSLSEKPAPTINYRGLVGGNNVPVAVETRMIQRTPPSLVVTQQKPGLLFENHKKITENQKYTNLQTAEQIRQEQERIQKKKLDQQQKDYEQIAKIPKSEKVVALLPKQPTIEVTKNYQAPYQQIQERKHQTTVAEDYDWFKAITERKDIAPEPKEDEDTADMNEVIDKMLHVNTLTDDEDTIEDPDLQ